MRLTIEELRTSREKSEKARKSKRCTVILSTGKKLKFCNGIKKEEGGSVGYAGKLSDAEELEFWVAYLIMTS